MKIYILEIKHFDKWEAVSAFLYESEAYRCFQDLHTAGDGCRVIDYDTGEVLELYDPETVKREEVVYCEDCGKRIKKGGKVYWYDCVEYHIDNKEKVVRRYFCTEGCATHSFQTGTLKK